MRGGPINGNDVLRQVRTILGDGRPLGDVIGISRQDRNALYAAAYALYAEKRYDLARHVFAQLALCDHRDSRYMKGLAATTQMLGDYEQAIQMYSMAVLMDATDPLPIVHAGDCLRKLGKHARAAESFTLARSMCSRPAQEQIKEYCDQALQALKKLV